MKDLDMLLVDELNEVDETPKPHIVWWRKWWIEMPAAWVILAIAMSLIDSFDF